MERKYGYTVVIEYRDGSDRWVGFQVKERAERELEYLKKKWAPDKPLYNFHPIKMTVRRVSYQAWLNHV